MHGWLILDKPVGLGSTQAVGAVKRLLREAGAGKVKVGHGGTLDPLASGVLPVAVGEATKLTGRMLDADKRYDFTVAFGTETDTLDGEGRIAAESDVRPTRAQVEAVLPRFTGAIRQEPPAFSALKVAGRRAYDLARAGETVALAWREVTVQALQLLPGTGRGTVGAAGGGGGSPLDGWSPADIPLHQPAATSASQPAPRDDLPPAGHLDPLRPPPRAGEELEEITLSALVSKGTYIRSLARDVARALGTVGHVTMLRRTKAGPFALAQAITLDNLRQAARGTPLQALLLPLTAGLDDIPALALTPDQAAALRQGRRLDGAAASPGLHLACLGQAPVALVEVGDDVRVVRGFNPMSENDA